MEAKKIQVNLRLTPEILDKLKKRAANEKRTFNSLASMILEKALQEKEDEEDLFTRW